ncbi:MAG: FtsB family cell division protein [Dysgonomonas sp.]
MKSFFSYIKKHFSKVQLVIVLVLIVFAFFVSDSNLFARFSYDSEIRDLNKQIDYYKKQKEDDARKLKELKSNSENVEKFARENYLMKKQNEDLFIIEENKSKDEQ